MSLPPARRPGRPPILTACVRCSEPRPRRDYVGTSSGVCKACRREIRGEPASSTVLDANRAYTDQIYVPPKPLAPELKEVLAFGLVNHGVSKLMFDLKLPLRCECCWETRHVKRDGYGGVAVLCARCDYHVCSVGACSLHLNGGMNVKPRVYYPELAAEHAARGGGPVTTPIEIERLFYVPESQRPKHDPADVAAETAD